MSMSEEEYRPCVWLEEGAFWWAAPPDLCLHAKIMNVPFKYIVHGPFDTKQSAVHNIRSYIENRPIPLATTEFIDEKPDYAMFFNCKNCLIDDVEYMEDWHE